jgi:excisionase family DNA binding protein
MNLLTVREVCALTGLHRSHLSRLRSSGKFPSALRIGVAVMFKQTDVDGWLRLQGLRCRR